MSRESFVNETCFEAIISNVLHHRTNSFHSSGSFRLQHDKTCNMVNCPESTQTDYPHCSHCERTMTYLSQFYFLSAKSDLLNRLYIYADLSLFCHVLALIVLVLQVGVKNIQIYNNHVPFGQLRDLTAH